MLENEIMCPYCRNDIYIDSLIYSVEFNKPSTSIIACWACYKKFNVTVSVTLSKYIDNTSG